MVLNGIEQKSWNNINNKRIILLQLSKLITIMESSMKKNKVPTDKLMVNAQNFLIEIRSELEFQNYYFLRFRTDRTCGQKIRS